MFVDQDSQLYQHVLNYLALNLNNVNSFITWSEKIFIKEIGEFSSACVKEIDEVIYRVNGHRIENNSILCEKCINKINRQNDKYFLYLEILSIYFKSALICYYFNTISENDLLCKVVNRSCNKSNKKILNIIKEKKDYSFFMASSNWKGIAYYWQKIFDIPYYLDKTIDYDNEEFKEHYKFRNNIYFHDYICGHPKASHGWYKEAFDELEEMGVFKN